MSTWRAMVRLPEPIKIADTMPFADYLIRQHEIADAQEVWTAMARISPSLRPSTSDANLIVNGSFDEEIIPGGFSWHLEPPATKSLQLDDRELHTGTASAAFNFEGPSFLDFGFYQLVPVKPNQLYELRFDSKSQEIVSGAGPRITVDDAFTHTNLAQGSEWIGTHPWGEQSFLFTTKPDTHLLRIYVGRSPGAGLIRGKLWLDNIKMYER